MVVLVPPLLREHLHLPEGIKDLPIQELVPQLAIEALYVPVLPWATRRDEEGLDPHPLEPRAHCHGSELRAVVRTEVLRYTPLYHEVPQAINDMGRA